MRLRALGHTPLLAPLLETRRLEPTPPLPAGVQALAFTSANGVRAFAATWDERACPVFAVGEATARAARAKGFTSVRSADGDVAALAALIASTPLPGLVLHACARARADDLEGRLAASGCTVATLPIYETVAVERLPAEASEALEAGALAAVLLHSPKAAAALALHLEERPAVECERLRIVGLSAACTAPLAGLRLRAVEVAARPTEGALLERLG